MTKNLFISIIFIGLAFFGLAQNNQRAKKEIPQFSKNIFSISFGLGKYGSSIFQNLDPLRLTNHTFKYTHRFTPRFGVSVYRIGSKTKDILNLTIKSKHTFLALRFTSSAKRPLQFFFSPGVGIGKYPSYSTANYDTNGNYMNDNGPLKFQENYNYLDIGSEMGFEYHFANNFTTSLSYIGLLNFDGYGQYSFSAGIGVKF